MAFRRRSPEPPTEFIPGDDRAFDDDALWCDGVWIGPRSLRVFVRRNRFIVGFWVIVFTGMSIAFWADVIGLKTWVLILPLAIPTATAAAACFAFAFSRGWIGDGD